jgi:hypothetical protein
MKRKANASQSSVRGGSLVRLLRHRDYQRTNQRLKSTIRVQNFTVHVFDVELKERGEYFRIAPS